MMGREEYCAQVLAALRHLSREEKEAVRAELEAHMEDHACALMELGYDEQLAEERTMAAMGDPAEVGREMDRQYPRYWDRLTGVSVAISIVMVFVMVLGIGSLGFLWDSIAFRFRAPVNRSDMAYAAEEERDIRVVVGNDVLRVYRISVGDKEGERVAEVAVCSYDRIPGGIVSAKLLDCLTAESQRGETRWDGGRGGGGGHWLAEYARLRAPVRPGDDHITLRYERFGQSVTVDVPLPEEGGA